MLSKECQWIFSRTMQRLDAQYDREAALLRGRRGHGVRDSVHYALGLLERDTGDDREQALRVIGAILDQQFEARRDDPFYGTFKRSDTEPDAPHAAFPGMHFDAWSRYYMDVWQEAIGNDIRLALQDAGFTAEQNATVAQALRGSILKNVPIVWESYDPNWREFIGTTFSLILARHERKLPQALRERLCAAMERAVEGSIERRTRNVHPMNTNVELMHIYICDFYGAYLQRGDFTQYAQKAADAFMADFEEYGTVAEFNSPTYYCVDFMALSIWRQMAPSQKIRDYGAKLEEALWREVSETYHPGLKAICGPYSRSYELDIRLHTSYPSLFYMALGAETADEPVANSEDAGGVDLSLMGTCVPEDVKERLRAFYGEHDVRRTFKELIERGAPNANRPACTTSAHLAADYMIGAARGSRNTSGQLRAAVAAWKAPSGHTAYMALLRRAPGEHYNTHYRTVYLDAQVEQNTLKADVRVDVRRDIEVYFEIDCPEAKPEAIAAGCFDLPGMRIHVQTDAPAPQVKRNGDKLEVIYLSRVEDEKRTMHFEMTFEKK